MKNKLCMVLILVVFNIQAQDIITKNVGDFTEIKVFDKIEVALHKASENKVEIYGVHRNDVDVVHKDHILKIKMSLDNLWDDNDIKVKVFYTAVSKLDVNEGAKIIVEDKITANIVDVRAQEGGTIMADIVSDKLLARAVTGGQLHIKGTIKEQEVTVKAGGKYHGKKLKSESTHVKITAGGRATVYASTYVKATATAGGTIQVYGNPKKMDSKKVFGGKIIELN